LREHKGYTYGAYSNLDARKLAGTFRATAEVRTAVTGASLHEFFYELDRIRNEAVSQKRSPTPNHISPAYFRSASKRKDGLIDQLVNNKMYGLPEIICAPIAKRVSAVTTDEILAVAEKYVTPDSAAIVIVGDAAEINEQIKPYSEKVEVYDTDGDRKH
jgi:zinc protease